MNETQNSRWKHPHGFDILKKLGIVERSANSLSEGDEEFDNHKFKMKEKNRIAVNESDEEIVFDRDSLLKNGSKKLLLRHSRSIDCARSLPCQMILLSVAFFIVGLCLAIVGPTLPDLQLHTKSPTFSLTVSVVSANAFGIILGISCAGFCYSLLNALCVITFALWLCALTTLIIPWCTSLTSAAFIFVAQGLSLGFVLKGVYTLFYTYWKRKYNVLLCFYVALAAGATMSPLVTSSFVANQLKHSQITTLSVSQSLPPLLSHKLMSKRDIADSEIDVKSVINNETLSVGETICNESNANCTNFTSFDITTAIPKAKKPQIYDATGIDPPQFRGDSNVKDVLAQPSIKNVKADVISTTELAMTVSSKNSTNETDNEQNVSATSDSSLLTTYSVTYDSISQPLRELSSTSLTSAFTSLNETRTTTAALSSAVKGQELKISNNSNAVANSLIDRNVNEDAEDSTFNVTDVPHLLSISTIKTNSTSENIIVTSPGAFLMSDVPKNAWDFMLKRVEELNNVRVAYLVISVISLISTTLYVFMCCCSSCRFLKPTIATSDHEEEENHFQLSQLCSKRINLYACLVSWLFCFLSGGVESVMSNLLTVYCVTGFWKEQSTGVLLTTTYWLFVSLGRMAALGIYKKLWQTNCLAVCLALSFISCGIMVVFSSSWVVLCICVAAIGLTTGHLTPMIFCWLDQQLGLPSWFVNAWLCTDQLGRATIAPLTAYGMLNHSPHMMPIVVLISTVFLSVIAVVMRKIVIQASQMNSADVVVTRHLKSSNGKFLEYHRHVDEIDGLVDEIDDSDSN